VTQTSEGIDQKKSEKKKGKLLDRFRIRVSNQEFTIEIFNQDLADDDLKKYSVFVNGNLYSVEVEHLGVDNASESELKGKISKEGSIDAGSDEKGVKPKSDVISEDQSTQMPKAIEEPESITNRSIRSGSGSLGENTLSAPMPGKILEIKTKIGDQVEAGQPLVILEAMKMENVMTAPASGIVKEIPTKVGVNVNQGDPLIVIE
jgi:glutaconyl-CoA decarboxylase